jgi:UDP-GlcNAc:undecaprenyl-phosphate GlcNAc-1-phosphate transferase
MVSYLPLVVGAFALALIGTPVAKWFALRLGLVDLPSARKLHSTPMPLLGGLAIYAATVLALFLFWSWDQESRTQVLSIVTGATLLSIMGVLDDWGKLNAQIKLAVGMPLAAIILILSGVHFTFFPYPLLNYAATVLWVMAITSAVNLLDNMDGLSSGITAIASAFFLWLAAANGQFLVSVLAACLLGASLGFLRYNFSPAVIFMGDGGSLFIGFLLAVLGIKLRLPGDPWVTWLVPVLILGVPIFDTSLVIFSRLRRGLVPMTAPGKDHFSHRLVAWGLRHRQAVVLLYGLALVLGVIGVLISQVTTLTAYLSFAAILGCAGIAMIQLEKIPYEHQERVRG